MEEQQTAHSTDHVHKSYIRIEVDWQTYGSQDTQPDSL